MSEEPFIYFFYRTPYENPLGRRLVKLKAKSILNWFQRGWDIAQCSNLDPHDWVEQECQGSVYGLYSIFEIARSENLARPTTWLELKQTLHNHWHTEGGFDYEDSQKLRVITDDDELQLGYFFFERSYAEQNPGVVKYLFTEFDDFGRLPEKPVVGKAFVPPFKLKRLKPGGRGSGVTYICILTWHDGESFELRDGPLELTGLRLPEFVKYMQNVKGNNVPVDDWPVELQLLRYWITESDRMNTLLTRWDQNAFLFCTATSFAWPQPFEQMRELRMKNGNPEKSRLQVSEHFALLCSHQGSGDKYRGPKEEYFQLFFFDDFWASANPELAESIMRYSFNWDPFSDGKKTY